MSRENCPLCPQQESNLYSQLRRLTFYPLNYEDMYYSIAYAPEAHPPWAGSGKQIKTTDMYYVYILYSKKLKKRYIGRSSNLRERVRQHKLGQSVYTRQAKDWILIYYEVFLSKRDAAEEEKFLKSGKGRERLSFLLSDTIVHL